jgi:ribosomal protein L32
MAILYLKNLVQKMRAEGKVSKVAICENCGGFILASHVDFLDSRTEKEFTELTNEGFTVKLETVEETRARHFALYKDCKSGVCS